MSRKFKLKVMSLILSVASVPVFNGFGAYGVTGDTPSTDFDPNAISGQHAGDSVARNNGEDTALGAQQNTPSDVAVEQQDQYEEVARILPGAAENADPNARDGEGRTPLHIAAKEGNVNTVKSLIARGAVIDALDNDGDTPLHYAAEAGKLDVVKYLVEICQVNVNVLGSGNNTPLHKAVCRRDNLEIVKYLVDHGANVNAANDKGYTPFHSAVRCRDNLEIVKYLVDHGANVNAASDKGYTPLHEAVCQGHLEIVKYLVEHGAVGNLVADTNWTVLHEAAYSGRNDIAKYLLDNSEKLHLDINAADAVSLDTALMVACEQGNLKIVEYLIEHGADTTRENVSEDSPSGLTAVELAAGGGYIDVVRYLVEKAGVEYDADFLLSLYNVDIGLEDLKYLVETLGADVNVATDVGYTPLHEAVCQGHLEIVKYLVDHGANVNATDIIVGTPLHYAAKDGNLEIVKYLVDHGANVNAANDKGYTPFHSAVCCRDNLEIVKYLVDHGANVNAASDKGYTPLHGAVCQGHLEIVKYLVEHGAVGNLVADTNWTVLHEAAYSGRNDIAKYLLDNSEKLHLDINAAEAVCLDTALMVACEQGNLEIVKYLLEHLYRTRGFIGGQMLRNCEGETILHTAARWCKLNIVQYLVENLRFDVNLVDYKGATPLHVAVAFNYGNDGLKLFQYLINHGANPLVSDFKGNTVLHYAAAGGNLNIVECLVACGSDVDEINLRGQTPLDVAISERNRDICNYLCNFQSSVPPSPKRVRYS